MFYVTEIDKVDCHKGVIGYQVYLIRANGSNNSIECDIFPNRAAAVAFAQKILTVAADLFEALDEQGEAA